MKEYNESRAYFNFILGKKPTATLPSPKYSCLTNADLKFHSQPEANFYDFMNLQSEIPQLANKTHYTSSLPENHALPYILFSGKASFWLPDFETSINNKGYYIEVKGASNQLVRLKISLRDKNRDLWKAVRHDLRNIALRGYTHVMLECACPQLNLHPLLFLSRTTIDFWIQSFTEFRSEAQLEATLLRESKRLQNHLVDLFGNCFEEDWLVFEKALELYVQHCTELTEPACDPESVESVLLYFADSLEHAKTLLGYDDSPKGDDRRFAKFLRDGLPTGLTKYYPVAPVKRYQQNAKLN
jgi:hypothetical protein